MLLKGHLNSNKTEILIKSYADLLNKGIEADKILVIVQNAKKKAEFIEKTKELLEIDSLTSLNVYTFFGLVYNKILDFWPLIENKIKDENSKITPNLSGLEVSQYIFKNAVNEVQFKGYNSKMNLLHQLLRRYSLSVLNALTPDEIRERAKILQDPFFSDIKNALNLYKLKTLNLRAFDYLRQADIFKFVYENSPNPYEYVFLDDGDEITPACFEYLTYIKNDIKEFFIAYDDLGCTRKGFLGALEFDFEAFLAVKAENTTGERPENLIGEKPIPDLNSAQHKTKIADEIFYTIKASKEISLENSEIKSFIRQDEMVEETVNKINALLSDPLNKLKPSDIAIITPNIDDYLKIGLQKINAPVQYLSGSEKLSKNPVISSILEILKAVNTKNLKISPYVFRGILAKILKLDFKDVLKISAQYEASDFDIFQTLKEHDKTPEIKDFLEMADVIKGEKLSAQIYAAAEKYIPLTAENKDIIYKINQLLKQVRDFEEIFSGVSNRDLLFQIENTIISENPIFSLTPNKDSVTVSTAQKIIDNSINSKHTFLLDTTSSNWAKQDIGPLYNAWVFQKSWKKKTFELEDNINCALDKTARILRKIYLLNSGKIYIYSSIYDFLGTENFKGINHFFKSQKSAEKEDTQKKPVFKIIPRPDQAPVLEYQTGKMAVSAVAGAGKTTIMLALIIKLLDEGAEPQNIFVLTFMDSAARNFKERIKDNFPNLVELPHISTIHGLALRILRENNNHTKLNLDVDFEILDEIKRSAVIKEIISETGLNLDKAELYERAISAYKNQKHPNPDRLSPLFKRIYSAYKTTLLSSNYIDYDDLLSLSLTLLRKDKGVREYYQNLMKFVIEDEAQDSSEIQQELIRILTEKHKNLIRTGDVNQAITTTFSNADVAGFKRFIKENKNVEMNFSMRNSTGVIDFANTLIESAKTISNTAFLQIKTHPVEGKNIIDKDAVKVQIFETEKDEKEFILKKIEEIYAPQNTPNAPNGITGANSSQNPPTVGILLRSNREVGDWCSFLDENTTLKFSTNSDTLNLNPVFRTVLSVLNFINNPLDNLNILNFIKNASELGFYKDDAEIFDFLKTHNTPFILGENEYFTLFWDLKYFLSMWNLPIYEIAYKVGEFYFSKTSKKPDISLVSGIVSKIYNQNKTFEDTVSKLNSMADKINRTSIRLISDENTQNETKIRILTLHKSKGDEFDHVFIPALHRDNLPLSLENITIKENAKFIENVKTNPKTEGELKKEILDENLRLIYVGITRAKQKLYLTSAKEYKIFNRMKKKDPSEILTLKEGGWQK